MTQKQAILDYVEKHGSITPMEAFVSLGCTRLAARVKELREDGYRVITHKESGKDRDGKTVYYARYTIKGE